MKYRIKISQIVTLLLLAIAKPYCWDLFAAGMALGALGEALRLWSAGNLYKDKKLATCGPYKMTRNPLYLGSFIMALGFSVACINPAYPVRTTALILAVLLGFKFVYRMQVEAEEIHLKNLFAADYEQYCAAVPRYLPKLGAWGEALSSNRFTIRQANYNREYQTVLGFLCVALFVAVKLHMGL
ncbi:MAG: isoprenylcysteine carboxylmethyltransferase family protein [Elusimicrobiaceae bacterium]|nr:isoprenylcysteine carboxylmethyltransferase family protein [Elusimicrobiaceae bacterium]